MYMLLRSFEPPNLPFPASMLSIRTASMPFTCCFEASNNPIFHSRPVCYLYVLPVCHLHAASKLRTTQSSIPGQYANYTYSSMPFTCCFETSNHPIFHSRPKCYLYVLPVCHAHAASKLRTTHSYIPGQYAIYTYSSMPFTCCFEASNHPIFHSRPVCYLYVLPVCHLHAASKLLTSQSSIPSQNAIYTYCQYAMHMLLQSFEPPNLPFPASMLSIRTASMQCTCCFEASNHPIFHSRPVCYLYVLQYAIYMLLRSFEPPNLPFPASMLSIRTASMPFTCCFEASNQTIFHSQPVCYLYVLPMCHVTYDVHAASKLRTTKSSIPSQYAIYTYCQYAMHMLL